MSGAITNFVLARTLLNQGPSATAGVISKRPELLQDEEEQRTFLMVAGAVASRLTEHELQQIRVGRYGNVDLHGKIRKLASRVRSGATARPVIDTILEELAKLSPARFSEVVIQTRETGLSLFGPPAEMSARVGAALRTARDARSATTDPLADDTEVGDTAILAERERKHINKALVQIATNCSADADEARASRAISRLIHRAIEGDKDAAEYIRRLTMGHAADAGLRDGFLDMKKVHRRFTREHVEALKTARGSLDKTDSHANNLDRLLSQIQLIRPDLFSE